jgi:hypothetical protein
MRGPLNVKYVNLVSAFYVSVFEDIFPLNFGTDIFQIILIKFILLYGLSDLLTYKYYVYLGLLDFVSVDGLSVYFDRLHKELPYIKRNVEKVWGARYLSKNTVIHLSACILLSYAR